MTGSTSGDTLDLAVFVQYEVGWEHGGDKWLTIWQIEWL